MAKKIKVTLKKSLIGQKQDQIATVVALGLKKINSEAVHDDTPQIRGMVGKVNHLVLIEDI